MVLLFVLYNTVYYTYDNVILFVHIPKIYNMYIILYYTFALRSPFGLRARGGRAGSPLHLLPPPQFSLPPTLFPRSNLFNQTVGFDPLGCNTSPLGRVEVFKQVPAH